MNNKKKVIIASLLGMVVCLGIGFAAFSTTLKINGSAKVSPNEDNYKVLFVSSVDSASNYDRSDFDGIASTGNVEPGKGHFEDDTTFTNTGLTFSEDGQSVDYKFYILNAGKYDAHITNLDIGNKTCTPGEDADATLAEAACNSINLSVILGDEGNQTTYTSSQAISDHVLPKGTWEQIIVRITYPEGSTLVDGDLDVEWEDISFVTATSASYVPTKEDYSSCFISTVPGEINGYNLGCPKNVVIPDDLELPLSQVKDSGFSIEKCMLQVNNAKFYPSVSEEICQNIEVAYEAGTIDEYEDGIYADAANLMFQDIEYEIVDNTLTKVTKIGDVAFVAYGVSSLSISSDISEIGMGAFAWNDITGKLSIPNNVSSIGTFAFQGNSVNEIEIGSGVTEIGFLTFGITNNSIEKVSIHNLEANVIIDDNAFDWISTKNNSDIIWDS